MSDLLPVAPVALAGLRVFRCSGTDFTVADLARHGQVGDRARFPGFPGFPGLGSSAQVAEAFRRTRGLLTADALVAWLERWAIEPEDFVAWTQDVVDSTHQATGWCALVCSGAFDAITNELVAATAAAAELEAPPTAAADFDPAGWVERLVSTRATDPVLQKVIDAHRLDWTRLDALVAQTPDRGVAEELRHQVISDRIPLDQATRTAGAPAERVDAVVSAVAEPAARAVLAGARPGELLGPVPTTPGWTVIQVLSRTEPSLEDPATRARAAAVLRNDVIVRAVARHVVA
ncbi:MAG: hypothetical protein NTV23_03440 [Propionibacteriales bacterium]|nr:hypothetical protein [Propionibacteriales bacterium]